MMRDIDLDLPITVRPATATDLAAIHGLLREASLPLDGVPDDLRDFLVATRGQSVVAAIGLERYGSAALLRSAVVAPSLRGQGLGERLVESVIELARASGVQDLVLLTTTAMDWFPRFGFERIDRSAVPRALESSAELRGACPASAIVMRRRL